MRWVWLVLFMGCGGDASEDEAVAPTRFGFPVAERDRISDLIGVDHDPQVQSSVAGRAICTDYIGRAFPHCYDEHDGSDYLLDGAFEAMDAGSATVIAAAPGVVVRAHDGEYDRCRATLGGDIDCDGREPKANAVTLEHADGTRSLYWHLMKDSVAVAVGDQVARGDVLGLIGSSGISSFPHLHFEVQDAEGRTIDPYAGPESQETSWWCVQGPVDVLPGDCADD